MTPCRDALNSDISDILLHLEVSPDLGAFRYENSRHASLLVFGEFFTPLSVLNG